MQTSSYGTMRTFPDGRIAFKDWSTLRIYDPVLETLTSHYIGNDAWGEDYQIVLSDTPGIIKPAYEMQNSMMNFVKEALDDADILIYMIAIGETIIKDEALFKKIQNSKLPVVVLINKIDTSNQDEVESSLRHWEELIPKASIYSISALTGFFIPELLKEFGVEVIELYCEPTGHFPHNPEPLAENLTEISKLVVEHNADLGIVVDPDVDRLAFVCNDGSMFGEEYTLVAVGDYVTKHTPGNTVSNLSSTRALNDVTVKNGGKYFASAVGEVNVVDKMKAENAVIGGEGNGGIIYPESHYGRDALVGVGLFLTHLAKEKVTSRELRDSYPNYEMSKNKIQLTPQIDVDDILLKMKEKYKNERVNDIDGVKIDFANEWVHLRKSNTEPIIRVYSESGTKEGSAKIAQQVIDDIHTIINE